ncbi:hypothetical protein GQ53DRAFT_748620 [Thozetella sp. PMI_491]|nr:hypothetical protein GQ53DRAFT_748620 [Thozetella sp. PMI_491]
MSRGSVAPGLFGLWASIRVKSTGGQPRAAYYSRSIQFFHSCSRAFTLCGTQSSMLMERKKGPVMMWWLRRSDQST